YRSSNSPSEITVCSAHALVRMHPRSVFNELCGIESLALRTVRRKPTQTSAIPARKSLIQYPSISPARGETDMKLADLPSPFICVLDLIEGVGHVESYPRQLSVTTRNADSS